MLNLFLREYVLPSPDSKIPLSIHLSYEPITKTRFLLLRRPTDWGPILEDYTSDDNEEEDPSEDLSNVKESSGIKEDPSEDSSFFLEA
ncbi:hypothetical protein GYH30_004343 [Glycine max]|nr:hypothetical protein GYH30_004343 [Glycine max]